MVTYGEVEMCWIPLFKHMSAKTHLKWQTLSQATLPNQIRNQNKKTHVKLLNTVIDAFTFSIGRSRLSSENASVTNKI